jgi:hypothetical protein
MISRRIVITRGAIIKVHPDSTGVLKKPGHNQSVNPAAGETPKFIRLPRVIEQPLHLI